MDHQTLCDEQQSRAMFLRTTRELTGNGRAVTHPAVTTPRSLAGRCDHIIGLIDELLAPGWCADTGDACNEPRGLESPRAEPRAWGVEAGGDGVAS